MERASCPRCETVLDDYDEVIECPNCSTIMRLISWEPLTLQVVGDDLAEESRIAYQIEMGKILYKEPVFGQAKVIEIDISKPASALRFLRLTDYVLVVICGFYLLDVLIGLVQKLKYIQGPELILNLGIATILLFSVSTGYRHIGVINERVWHVYVAVFPMLLLYCLLNVAGHFLILITVYNGENEGTVSILLSLIFALYATAIVFLGLVAALQLRRMPVALLHISLAQLLSDLRSKRIKARKIERENKAFGVLVVVVGSILIFASRLILQPIDLQDRPLILTTVSGYILTPGLLLLVRSRRYFQARAGSILSVDKREPILFLRSFDDDEKIQNTRLWKSLLDFSLEVRLSNHFNYFGPFIAVGTPRETVPASGAVRFILSNREWLPKVSNWISESSLIVMYCGKTDWVNWELAKIIETNCVPNLMLMIPEIKGEYSIRLEDITARIERLREGFKKTRWSESLARLQGLQDVRVVLFAGDGSIVVIKSNSDNRDSYHLATLVAHYLMLTQESAFGLLHIDQAKQERLRR